MTFVLLGRGKVLVTSGTVQSRFSFRNGPIYFGSIGFGHRWHGFIPLVAMIPLKMALQTRLGVIPTLTHRTLLGIVRSHSNRPLRSGTPLWCHRCWSVPRRAVQNINQGCLVAVSLVAVLKYILFLNYHGTRVGHLFIESFQQQVETVAFILLLVAF